MRTDSTRDRAEPQAQSVSDTPDPSVVAHLDNGGRSAAVLSAVVTGGPGCTHLLVRTADVPDGLTIDVQRVLRSGEDDGAPGHVTAGWTLPDGSAVRGRYVVVHPVVAA